MRTDKLREEFDLQYRWSVFPLHPETPDDGLELNELFAGRYDIEAMLQRCRQVAKELDLPFGSRTRTYNSRRAQELGKWAEEMGAGEAFHMAVYHAYFVQGRNIAQAAELCLIAEAVGLNPDEARHVIDNKLFSGHVDDDWKRAAQFGVTAVPTSLFNEQALIGFQSYENYRRLITGV